MINNIRQYILWELSNTFNFVRRFDYPKTWISVFSITLVFLVVLDYFDKSKNYSTQVMITLFLILVLIIWKRYQSGEWKHEII